MNNDDLERESRSGSDGNQTNALMVEEARQSFFQLENWMTSIDLKASIIIAIDAIILSSLGQVILSYQKVPLLGITIILPPFLSIMLALFCLWPRGWKRPFGNLVIDKYANERFDYASARLARTYADCEKELNIKYKNKYRYFESSVALSAIALVVLFMLFFGSIFSL